MVRYPWYHWLYQVPPTFSLWTYSFWGEHHIMRDKILSHSINRDSHWRRSVAPTTTRISGFHMVLLSTMHACSCCSNLNPLTTIETFVFFVCKTLKLSGVSGGVPSAFPQKTWCCPCIRSAVPAATAHKNAPEKLLATAPMEVQQKTPWVAALGHTHDLFWATMSIMMIA